VGRTVRSDIDELLRMKHGGQRAWAVLTLLYAGLDLSKQLHPGLRLP
jgi:hypothetical protein